MGEEVELVSEGTGLAVIGEQSAVQRFLASEGLPSTELVLSRLATVRDGGSTGIQVGATVAEQSGRWVKLTKESADKVKEYGLTATDTPGVSHAMIGERGSIDSWIQIVDTGLLTSPALLSGAAGILAQQAMKQSMAEITDYLVRIDEKLDDVLRSQTNEVLARMDGVDLAIKEAMSVRNTVARVSDVTWSKVQHSSTSIFETQAFAIRQLADLTNKIEDKAKVENLAKIAKTLEAEVNKWLTAIARCFQLHDSIAVIELDRVMDTAPDELDQHRLGLGVARQERLELISETTQLLLERMAVAANTANEKILLNPIQSPAVVKATNQASGEVHEFRQLLEIESREASSESRRWGDAASEQWGKVRDASTSSADTAKGIAGRAGAAGVGSAKSLGSSSRNTAQALKGRFSRKRTDDEATE